MPVCLAPLQIPGHPPSPLTLREGGDSPRTSSPLYSAGMTCCVGMPRHFLRACHSERSEESPPFAERKGARVMPAIISKSWQSWFKTLRVGYPRCL